MSTNIMLKKVENKNESESEPAHKNVLMNTNILLKKVENKNESESELPAPRS